MTVILCADQSYTTVSTPLGDIRGTITNNTRLFRGIPYAEKPLGKLRFADPVKITKKWVETFNATQFGSCCMQNTGVAKHVTISEDCLYLNIWAPMVAENVPVMIWIHGGGFIEGCSSLEKYWGTYYAESSDTIVVSLNYRLGPFGFIASDKLAGNFGLKDQMLVFQWVQENIKYFGGDPSRVTIFGESAGAMSVGLHLVSPLSAQNTWFEKAIMESNPYMIFYETREQQKTKTKELSVLIACSYDDLDCYRDKSAEFINDVYLIAVQLPTDLKLRTIFTWSVWGPTVEGNVVVDQPLLLLQQGKFKKVPMIIGANRNETASFGESIFNAIPFHVNNIEIDALMIALFGSDIFKLATLYPIIFKDAKIALTQGATDFLFFCPTFYATQQITKHGAEVRSYIFNHVPEHDDFVLSAFKICKTNVCHGAEEIYVFNSAEYASVEQSDAERALSKLMANHWIDFAHGKNRTDWPIYGTDKLYISFDIPKSTTESRYREKYCDYWTPLIETLLE